MAKQNATKPATEVERAEQTLATLRQKREALVAHGCALEEERGKLAYAAHTGDETARKKLDSINREAALQGSELRSLDAAVAEATARVEQAQRAEAMKAAEARAAELRKIVSELSQVPGYIDKHFKAAIDGLLGLEAGFDQLRALGINHPGEAQIRLSVVKCINSWAWQMPESYYNLLREGLKYPAPHERENFSAYWRRIELSLENGIRRLTGERPLTESPRPLTAEERLDEARRDAPPSFWPSGGAKPPKSATKESV
jgi:hypothetical protein